MSAIDHARILFCEHRNDGFSSKFIAILHDDDWWLRDHLRNALVSLNRHTDATFYGSSHFDVFGESSLLVANNNLIPWFVNRYPKNDQVWKLSPADMLVSQLMGGLCHYSSMVIRTAALKKASRIYDLDHAVFDNDRMLQYELSRSGPVLYNPMPQVFIRQHEGREAKRSFTVEERENHRIATTKWIVRESGRQPEDIIAEFQARMDTCPEIAQMDVGNSFTQSWSLPVLFTMMKKAIT